MVFDYNKKNLVLFITHNFQPLFVKRLIEINQSAPENMKVIVLFDAKNNYDPSIQNKIPNIEIIKIHKIITSYDHLGHTLYIHYLLRIIDKLDDFNYIWVIENDVYFHGNFLSIIHEQNAHHYDLLVPEYGLREPSWVISKKLHGFQHIENIGILGVIMRFSSNCMKLLLEQIDNKYFGFFEALLPNFCRENNLSIQQFLPRFIGFLTTDKNNPLIKIIHHDIHSYGVLTQENKLYHPIKA
jgi:hypothetical protein